ncbi:MAG TPA: hypothetical protein VFT42_02555 [Solirubrobacteraceae bacterium]|nr:hypothetical protein [Solirubrobacteraceae bacterium]
MSTTLGLPLLATSAAPPARGAPLGDLIPAAIVAMLLSVLLIGLLEAYRRDRLPILARAAKLSERVSGQPGWAALPALLLGVSLLTAVIGLYWDVATHIDNGRDQGPFGTTAHYPILAGLGGVAVCGLLAITLGWKQRGQRTWVRIQPGWRAPLGGVLIAVCGVFALVGFPLDDVWHRLFGQDVTLWGPTHLLMIGGASLSTLGAWALHVEGRRAARDEGAGEGRSLIARALGTHVPEVLSAGAFLLGMSTFQGEFDYGVPQFQLVYHPILIMLAAGLVLVPARLRIGRGGALGTVAMFLVLRGLLSVLVGPVLGHVTPHFPLYVAEALCVELAVARFGTRRPLTSALASGVLIGTLGLAAEWGWTHVWMPIAWPSSLLAQAAPLGFAAAIAGATLGGFIGRAIRRDPAATQHAPRWLAPAAGALAVFCIAFPLPMSTGSHVSADIALRTLHGAPERTVAATIRLHPANAADGADWFTLTAWQGRGRLVLDHLRRTGAGVYETTKPIPVHGKWKAMLRLARGRALSALPVYLPADPAIPARAVPASAHIARAFVRDKKVLQREAVGGTPALAAIAYLILLAIAATWIAILVWGLRRLDPSSALREDDDEPRFARDEEPAPEPLAGSLT